MNLRDEWRERVAEVLIQHQRIPLFDDSNGQRCVGCDSLSGEPDGSNSPRHAAHLADQLLAPGGVVAGIVAEAEQQARVPAVFLADDHEECDRAERAAYERGAAEALLEAANARSEWQATLNAEDDRHFASGSMHGAGPDVACDVFEDFLRERAATAQNPPSDGRTGSGEGASTPDVSRGGERGEG